MMDAEQRFGVRFGPVAQPDRTWDLRGARLVNAPAVAVTGRRWDDDTTDFRAAPEQYGAVHFHSDDLEDAGWEPCCTLQVPPALESGVYAFELRAGDLEDHVPFVVRPAAGSPGGAIGLLLPTLTYQVYGNERLVAGGEGGMVPEPNRAFSLDPADHWLAAHPEAGRSCYDLHTDGHGVSLVSMRRPIPNLRPSFVWWVTEAPERFGSDLYVVDWLEERGEAFDVFTDHDLHADGAALLDGYRVLLTGTHPEYWSRPMLDALQGWLERGGRLMYLGGNGFYWVTSIDPERPHLAEVRRGVNGTRAWSSRPGELRHQTTGEQGGLWRYRGRDPNRLVGVGFASQCDSPGRAPGYRRTAASHDDEHAWIFEGVDTEMIGEHGLYLGGAAGYEIDRHDPAFGSPEEAVVLATSAGLHAADYLLVVEDLWVTIPDLTGPTTDRVRADLTYLPYPNGGAVFSVGSCSWCGSLSTGGYDNDISRITGNVLSRFLS
jgi:N,N-dimethylformamidase